MSKKLLAHALLAYIGTKSVLATTMTRGEYNDYRDWQIPENEDPSEQGYLVEYTDGGKPNDERHTGYISWSPADVFECSYKKSPKNHIERMQSEKHELDIKLDALKVFLAKLDTEDAPLLTDDQVNSLELQAEAMGQYSNILAARIEYDAELIAALGD